MPDKCWLRKEKKKQIYSPLNGFGLVVTEFAFMLVYLCDGMKVWLYDRRLACFYVCIMTFLLLSVCISVILEYSKF